MSTDLTRYQENKTRNSIVCLSDTSLDGIKDRVDRFLKNYPNCKPLNLILPAGRGAIRFGYKGMSIRQWSCNGIVRYDVAADINSA